MYLKINLRKASIFLIVLDFLLGIIFLSVKSTPITDLQNKEDIIAIVMELIVVNTFLLFVVFVTILSKLKKEKEEEEKEN